MSTTKKKVAAIMAVEILEEERIQAELEQQKECSPLTWTDKRVGWHTNKVGWQNGICKKVNL